LNNRIFACVRVYPILHCNKYVFKRNIIMTEATLHPHDLAREVQNVSTALLELAVATRRLVAALLAPLTQRKPLCMVKTAFQAAAELRSYADTLYPTDPRFAQDLYAAADRHERAAQA
jgi:hypothetical protein